MTQATQQQALYETMLAGDLITPDTYAVEPRYPEQFAEAFGQILPYFRDVEWLVKQYAQDIDTAIGPDKFRERWLAEEVSHGLTYEAMLCASGVSQPLPVVEGPTAKFRMLGKLCSRSTTAASMVRLAVATIGHLNEATNIIGQRAIIRKMRQLGEKELARTVGAMAAQERQHDEYYELERQRLSEQMQPRVLRAVEFIVTRSFTPVGANDPAMRQRFGAVMQFLVEDEQTNYDQEKFLEQIDRVSFAIFDRDGKPRERVTKEQAMITSAFIACKKEFIGASR